MIERLIDLLDKIVVLGLIPLVPVLVSYYKKKSESIKRSSLRNEITTIVLSKNLKTDEKIEMTKDLLEQYEKLNGNHYVHALIEKLRNGELDERANRTDKL